MMSIQVTYRYKTQKPDQEQRRAEGVRTLKNYPSKVPVRCSSEAGFETIKIRVLATKQQKI